MSPSSRLTTALPSLQPNDPAARLFLLALRQMGAHGLHDACAAHAFVTAFGRGFQRPLILLRTFIAELSAASARPISIAPWCCPRMTPAEAALLDVLGRARNAPDTANLLLADLLGIRDAGGILATGHALVDAFADMGLPLEP